MKGRSSAASSAYQAKIRSLLQLAQLRSEKCEFKEAQIAYELALEEARSLADSRAIMECIAGLMRLAGEALDQDAVLRWDAELSVLMRKNPASVPSLAWYCKATVARYKGEHRLAQSQFHRYLRAVRRAKKDSEPTYSGLTREEEIARGWVSVATLQMQRGNLGRARWLAQTLLKRYEDVPVRTVKGVLLTLLGSIAEKNRQFEEAWKFYQRAHSTYLAEHNWYYHLYVLMGYARICREQQQFSQAYWYLDLVDKAANGPEFGVLRREVAAERKRLEGDAVDLLIDSRKGVIRTREGGALSLRKQYVLLHILEALSRAHSKEGEDSERGMSKAEIIETVWRVPYRPEAHDNKLYYNINRLRKLLEPDVRKPRYLLNWKEGYRLAPGLRVQWVQHKRGGGAANERSIG